MKTRLAILASLVALSLGGPALAQVPGGPRSRLGAEQGHGRLRPSRPQGPHDRRSAEAAPADRIWRAGENEVTILSTEVRRPGRRQGGDGRQVQPVRPRAPATGEWAIVLNSDLGQSRSA